MPLEVRIDVVPHGIEAARRTIDVIHITQVDKLDDDPEGERIYAVKGLKHSFVKHRRGDGAETLAALALAVDTGLQLGEDRG